MPTFIGAIQEGPTRQFQLRAMSRCQRAAKCSGIPTVAEPRMIG